MKEEKMKEEMATREEKVLSFLREHDIPFTNYNHPEGKTIEEAKRWWRDDGSMHCKNLFLDIHYLAQRLKEQLTSRGLPSCGKLSFASPERMMRYLGLEPGSVSPFGLINDVEHHVHLFLDADIRNAPLLSFHPNDCRGTVVIRREDFERYLSVIGNTYEYITLQ